MSKEAGMPGEYRLGIGGYGGAAGGDIASAVRSGHFSVVAAADPESGARERFHVKFDAPSFDSVEEMLEKVELDAILIATPTKLHEEQTIHSLESGVHVLVEKPISTSVASAERMIRCAEENRRVLMVNHKRSVDAPVIAMWKIAQSGQLGRVRAVHRWHFNDWYYRPRGLDERDPSVGGAVLRQGAHEFDIIRMLTAGSSPTALRGTTGAYDPSKPGEGSYFSWISFEDGTAATSIFGGYGHFLSEELLTGPLDPARSGRSKRRLGEQAANSAEEAELKRRSVGDPNRQIDGGFGGVYGYTLVNCEHGDMRPSPTGGVWIYGDEGRSEVTVSGPSGTDLMAEELYRAVGAHDVPVHDGQWGLACLELCVGVRESAASGEEFTLKRQSNPDVAAISRLLSGHQVERVDD